MSTSRPRVVVVEEGMREGMQIESAAIPLADKVALLDALSATGLRDIVVGSFVSPRWVPQMAGIDDLVGAFTPRDGVTYTALALNAAGAARRDAHTPPLSRGDGVGRSMLHLCDVFVRRNTNRSVDDELGALPDVVARAVADGATEATVAVNAAWGSNWLGPFDAAARERAVALQVRAWEAAGVRVTGIYLGDPMSWNTPGAVRDQVRAIVRDRPEVHTVHLHLHDARGTALTSAWAALQELDTRHTLVVDSAIGGIGGCPYCGNGRATGMIATEDLVHLLEAEGVETGIDLVALVEAAVLAERIVGRPLYGRVSKAGPRPGPESLYPMDMPLVETVESAQHFRLGPSAYAGNPAPWKAPIVSPARDAVERGEPGTPVPQTAGAGS